MMIMSLWRFPIALLDLVVAPLKYIMSALPEEVWSPDPDTSIHLEKGKGLLGLLTPPTNVLSQKWMSKIPDDRLLFQLSVPGTHDAAAYNYKGDNHEFWNCQNLPLLEQLDAGIRALDLRYGLDEGKLRFYHSTALLDKNAEVVDIIYGLNAWLRQHPSETIFASLKVDKVDVYNAGDTEVQLAMANVIEETKGFWVKDHLHTTTLGDARGKLVLVRRFPFTLSPRPFAPNPLGYDVSNNWEVNGASFTIPFAEDKGSAARIEDFYLLQGLAKDAAAQIQKKQGCTIKHLKDAQVAIAEDPKDLYITFTSAVGDRALGKIDEDVTPRVMALGRGNIEGMNKHIADWLSNNPSKPVGIVLMDFVDMKREASAQSDVKEECDLITRFFKKQALE